MLRQNGITVQKFPNRLTNRSRSYRSFIFFTVVHKNNFVAKEMLEDTTNDVNPIKDGLAERRLFF